MSNIINLSEFNADLIEYRKKIQLMNHKDILEEIVFFNDCQKAMGNSKNSIKKGVILFEQAAKKSLTPEFKQFANSYKLHLEIKLGEIRNGLCGK